LAGEDTEWAKHEYKACSMQFARYALIAAK